MLMPFLRVPLAVLALAIMCVTANADTLKDVRKVTVQGDGTVSKAVVALTGQQLKRAARATRRPVPLPKVAMDVQLSNEVRGVGAQAGRNSAEVTVVLRGGPGAPAASERFIVNSFMTGRKAADRALANAISQRIAVAYSLAPVKAAPTGPGRSTKAYRKQQQPSGQRRAASQAASRPAGQEKGQGAGRANDPVIIPSEAALTVTPRVRKPRPEANAATAPGPCVVTATTRCN